MKNRYYFILILVLFLNPNISYSQSQYGDSTPDWVIKAKRKAQQNQRPQWVRNAYAKMHGVEPKEENEDSEEEADKNVETIIIDGKEIQILLKEE